MRYLKGTRTLGLLIQPLVMITKPKEHVLELIVYVDSDWAGCTTTRKSTSGCSITVFHTTIFACSRTQSIIALSSGEAELYTIGLGVAE